MYKILGIAIFAAALCAPAAHAQDLLGVYNRALKHDPQFASVRSNYQAKLELRPQAKAQLYLPSIDFTANIARNWQNITAANFLGPGTTTSSPIFNSSQFTLSITQPIYHYDRFIALKQADNQIRQAQVAVDAAQQDLILRVAKAYFGVLAAHDNLKFAKAEKNALGRQLDQTKQRFDVGLIAITDVQEAKAGYDTAIAQEIAAKNQVDTAREALREITGSYPKELDPLGNKMPLISPDPENINAWTTTTLKQNLQIMAAQLAAQNAAEEINRQYAGHLPTLDLVGSQAFASSGGRFGSSDIDERAIGLQMNLPIYEGGQVLSRTREAQHLHEEALDQLVQQKRAAQRQARDAYLGVISQISQVKALKQAVVSNETSLKATEAGYEVGTRTAVDVVNAQRSVFQAKSNYAQARYNYILDTLSLKNAAGTLSPADLKLVNSWITH